MTLPAPWLAYKTKEGKVRAVFLAFATGGTLSLIVDFALILSVPAGVLLQSRHEADDMDAAGRLVVFFEQAA